MKRLTRAGLRLSSFHHDGVRFLGPTCEPRRAGPSKSETRFVSRLTVGRPERNYGRNNGSVFSRLALNSRVNRLAGGTGMNYGPVGIFSCPFTASRAGGDRGEVVCVAVYCLLIHDKL